MDAYATHQEALRWSLNKLGHDITCYEFGAGHYSTPMLHEAISKSLVSIETDEAWLRTFIHYENEIHKFKLIHPVNWVRDLQAMDKNVDMCFIDTFDGPSRVVAMDIFKDSAKLLIIHDQENVFENPSACYPGQYDMVMGFKYIKQVRVEGNITAVLSNKMEL